MKKMAFTGLTLSVLFISACNGENESGAEISGNNNVANNNNASEEGEESGAPEKPEELTIWVHDENVQIDAYEEITSSFTDEYGIEVEMVPYSMADQLDGLSLDGPQGLGPDLFYSAHDHMGNIHLQGLAQELELTKDQQERLDQYNDEAVTSFSYEGIQYGIPAVVETYVLFRNTDIVEDAPATMDELMEKAREHTEGDQYGFMITAADFYFTYPFLTGPGGYVFAQDEDGIYDTDDIGLATEGAVEGAEMIQSWYEEELIPTGVDMDILNGLFMEGNIGMAVTGPWAISDYRDAIGDSLEISPLPEWDGEPLTSFAGNKGWLVNYYSDHDYWATELALYMTNAESGELYFDIANELPAHNGAEIEDEFMEPVLEQIQVAEPMPNVPEMAQVWEPMADALNFIAQGDDAEEVLQEAVAQIENELAIMNEQQ